MKQQKLTFVASGLMSVAITAGASDYGCRVLLCLSNPAGPTAVSECVPPISRLRSDLSANPPRPFPTCEEANGEASTVLGYNPYDRCPDGMHSLEAGAYAMLASRVGEIKQSSLAIHPGTWLFQGIGEGDATSAFGQPDVPYKKVCVGAKKGEVVFSSGTRENRVVYRVSTYDAITTMDPAVGSPRYADVLINGKHLRRVRF